MSISQSYDESKKKSKQSDDINNIFSEGKESQYVSVLKKLFENKILSTTDNENTDPQERSE